MESISQGWFFSFESDRLEKWPVLAGLATVGSKTILKKFRITFDTQWKVRLTVILTSVVGFENRRKRLGDCRL